MTRTLSSKLSARSTAPNNFDPKRLKVAGAAADEHVIEFKQLDREPEGSFMSIALFDFHLTVLIAVATTVDLAETSSCL